SGAGASAAHRAQRRRRRARRGHDRAGARVSEPGTPVEIRGLAKTFEVGFFRKRVEALRGVDFEVREGEIFGVLGPNGAGKTTTIKLLLGLVFPTAGSIRLFGKERP